MKKLHSIAFYALVAPAMAIGAGSVLAQPAAGQAADRDQGAAQSTQREPGAAQSGQRAGQSDSQSAADRTGARAQSAMQSRGHIASAPAGGMQASNLLGANVKTATDDEIGSVNDLIIDQDGQIVAIIVGVGGFLGMGERDVAIGWDNVTRSVTSDDHDLRVDVTREDLRAAPEFELQD